MLAGFFKLVDTEVSINIELSVSLCDGVNVISWLHVSPELIIQFLQFFRHKAIYFLSQKIHLR